MSQKYRWTQATPHAAWPARDGAGALVFSDRMFLIGGWSSRDKENFPRFCRNDVWSSQDGAEWRCERPNAFWDDWFDASLDWEGRHAAGYVIHQNKMWIVGGDPNQGHYQFDVWNSDDGKNWNFVNASTLVPWGPRCMHGTLCFQNQIWIMGGQTVPGIAPEREIFYRDIWKSKDGISWEQTVPREPFWSSRMMIGGVTVFQDRIWVLGGGTYETPLQPQRKFYNDVWSSEDGANWQCHLENAPWRAREFHDVMVFDNRMWILGGYDGNDHCNDVWHSADGIHWEELPGTPWPIRHASSVWTYDGALWIGAGYLHNDVWKLQKV